MGARGPPRRSANEHPRRRGHACSGQSRPDPSSRRHDSESFHDYLTSSLDQADSDATSSKSIDREFSQGSDLDLSSCPTRRLPKHAAGSDGGRSCSHGSPTAAGAPIHRAELPRMATELNRPEFLSYPASSLDQDKRGNVHVDPQGAAINAFGARHVHAHKLCDCVEPPSLRPGPRNARSAPTLADTRESRRGRDCPAGGRPGHGPHHPASDLMHGGEGVGGIDRPKTPTTPIAWCESSHEEGRQVPRMPDGSRQRAPGREPLRPRRRLALTLAILAGSQGLLFGCGDSQPSGSVVAGARPCAIRAPQTGAEWGSEPFTPVVARHW